MGNDMGKPFLDLAQEAIGWQRDFWAGIQRRPALQPSLLALPERAATPQALLLARGTADDVLDRLRSLAAL